MLGVETRGNETLKATIASLSADKKAAEAARDEAAAKLSGTAGDLTTAEAQVATLNQNIEALRQQLSDISAALDLAKKNDADQRQQITDLGEKLNAALASKAEELARYRSEFFGDIKQILGDRPDIRIVGDRFVFQSEVLFPPGSDTFEATAQQQLAPVVKALKTIAGRIPENLNWILEVDGFTDKRPINTPDFHSNWELSTARAVSVVKYLIDQGVPPEHLAASGFGEFQPLEPGDSEADYRKNRRIELKLTQR
jgi:chemotaxis protein MotB